MADPDAVPSYRLRRRLTAALGSLVAIVLVCGVAATAAGITYRSNVATLHRLEVSARKAASIGLIAREQYIHEAHTIIVGDRSHLAHHGAWVARFEEEVAAFRADLDTEQAGRLDGLLADSRDLAHIFEEEIVPAVAAKDTDKVREAHDRAIKVVEKMTDHSDALEKYFEARAGKAERSAARVGSIMWPVSIVGGVLASIFALVVARRLWQAFHAPLERLKAIAERVSRGDHAARVGALQAEELAVVGKAFDAMLEALAAQEAKLVAAERLAAVGRVAAGVAHEINNPIAVIRGYLKTMEKEATSPAVQKELGILDEEAAACQRIAEDLLAYTRAPALFPENVDIVSLVEECVERCRMGPRKLETAMRVDVAPARLRVDPVRMKQVLANLLRNASEANAGGGMIDIEGRESPNSYRLSIADRGPGLSPEARDRMFEPFFTTRRDGVGLGLAVCYGLITAHGGKISASERAGGGLEVLLELPIEVPATP